MGRLEHNDDIDDRIIREIRACDFAIADLTYARPSVYFEAGYAQREVPVVYTCRRDHFAPKEDDQFGNLRVHFDLQMKNIVRWSSPNDQSFAAKLSRRVRVVIRPLVSEKESSIRSAEEESRFRGLPLQFRSSFVRDALRRRLKRVGWRPFALGDGRIHWSGLMSAAPVLNLLSLFVRSRWTQREIEESVRQGVSAWEYRLCAKKRNSKNLTLEGLGLRGGSVRRDLRGIVRVSLFVVLCSLEKVPPSRVAVALPSYAARDNVFTGVPDFGFRISVRSPSAFGNYPIPASVAVRLVDDIRSERDLQLKISKGSLMAPDVVLPALPTDLYP